MADTPKRSRRQGRGSHLNSWAKETTESQGFCHSPWPLRIAWVEPLLWFLTHPNIKSRSPAPLTTQSAHQCPPGWGRSTRSKHPGQWCHGQAGVGLCRPKVEPIAQSKGPRRKRADAPWEMRGLHPYCCPGHADASTEASGRHHVGQSREKSLADMGRQMSAFTLKPVPQALPGRLLSKTDVR